MDQFIKKKKKSAHGRQRISRPMWHWYQKNPAGKTNIDIKIVCYAWRFYTLYGQKFSNLRPLLSITFPQGFQKSKKFGHCTFGSGGKNTFKRRKQMRKRKLLKTFFAVAILHHLWAKVFISETTFFNYFSTKISKI